MSPIVFLDIDGVLNNNPWMEKAGFGTLDPSNIKRLVRLVQLTDADLVISSDWRLYHDYDSLCRRLINDGVPDCIIGTTPCLDPGHDDDEDMFPRGLEIDAWLKDNSFSGLFCILDDRDDMQPNQNRLVQTDDGYGLVDGDVEQAVLLLMSD